MAVLRKNDIFQLKYAAESKDIGGDLLEFHIHSPEVLGDHIHQWGLDEINPKLLEKVNQAGKWPYPDLFGVPLVYDNNLHPYTIQLRRRGDSEVIAQLCAEIGEI